MMMILRYNPWNVALNFMLICPLLLVLLIIRCKSESNELNQEKSPLFGVMSPSQQRQIMVSVVCFLPHPSHESHFTALHV